MQNSEIHPHKELNSLFNIIIIMIALNILKLSLLTASTDKLWLTLCSPQKYKTMYETTGLGVISLQILIF